MNNNLIIQNQTTNPNPPQYRPKTLSTLKKTSNVTVFERREKEFSNPKPKTKPLLYPKTTSNFYLTENTLPSLSPSTPLQSVPSNADTAYYGLQTEIPKKDDKYLRKIELCKATEPISPKSKTQINFKTSALNRRKESVNDYINKTRDVVLMKYTASIKRERAIRLKETFENEIEAINDTITSLIEARELFNDTFYSKFGEYVKNLFNQKELEKKTCVNLYEEKIRYKSEISQLQGRIRKIEQDRQNLIRWLFLQIRMKEKRLILPSYYEHIIEKEVRNRKEKIESRISIGNINCNPSLGVGERTFRRRDTKRLINFNFLLEVSSEEIERVKKYKTKLVFETADDFLTQLKKLEMDNISLINQFNALKDELYELNREKKELQKEKMKGDNILDSHLAQKEIELKSYIEKNNVLKRELHSLEMMMKNQGIKKHFPDKKKEARTLKNQYKKATLFPKILQLQKVMNTINVSTRGEKEKMGLTQYSRKANSTEGEMLNMLMDIEMRVDDLLGVFKGYRNNKDVYYETFKRIKNGIEKEHKLEKAKRQQNEEMLKWEKLKEQIEERNNKVFFKPIKKVDFYSEYVLKKKKNKAKEDNENNEPGFFDFMYDIVEERKLIRSHSQ